MSLSQIWLKLVYLSISVPVPLRQDERGRRQDEEVAPEFARAGRRPLIAVAIHGCVLLPRCIEDRQSGHPTSFLIRYRSGDMLSVQKQQSRALTETVTAVMTFRGIPGCQEHSSLVEGQPVLQRLIKCFHVRLLDAADIGCPR